MQKRLVVTLVALMAFQAITNSSWQETFFHRDFLLSQVLDASFINANVTSRSTSVTLEDTNLEKAENIPLARNPQHDASLNFNTPPSDGASSEDPLTQQLREPKEKATNLDKAKKNRLTQKLRRRKKKAREFEEAKMNRLVQKLRKRTPIFCAGLPKTGTTSIHRYFSSLPGLWSSHTYGRRNDQLFRTGRCMEDNWKANRPMLEGCGGYHAWSDQGDASHVSGVTQCFYPLWHALGDFYKDYPNATILLNIRNDTAWANSIQKWGGGSLARRWRRCETTPYLPKTKSLQEWIDFYNEYNGRIRRFCQDHPSLTCLEFQTEDPNAGQILEKAFGIPASSWGDCKPSERGCRAAQGLRYQNVTNDPTLVEPTPKSSQNVPIAATQRTLSVSESVCLATHCIQEQASSIARAFPNKTMDNWCIPNGNSWEDKMWQGILLVKVPKAASSTSAGVALRISNRHDCAVQWQHRLAHDYEKRNKAKSFLFTTIRDPAERAVSTIFFHHVSQKNLKPTDRNMIRKLNSKDSHYGSVSEGQGGFTMRYTTLKDIPRNSSWTMEHATKVLNASQVQASVKRIVDDYDFLLVVERMDESLVAMSIIMGVPLGDVLTTSSKVGGSMYHFKQVKRQARCYKTVKSFVSPKVQLLLESDTWRAQNYGDYLLHAAANQSLDRTVDWIGRDKFQVALDEFRRLRGLEKKVCAPHVNFPCSNGGKPQTHLSKDSCYMSRYDFGCGYKCIDAMLVNETT
jgi:hypothetical protein